MTTETTKSRPLQNAPHSAYIVTINNVPQYFTRDGAATTWIGDIAIANATQYCRETAQKVAEQLAKLTEGEVAAVPARTYRYSAAEFRAIGRNQPPKP